MFKGTTMEMNTVDVEMDIDIAIDNWLLAVKERILDPQVNNDWIKRENRPYMTLKKASGSKFLRIEQHVIGGQCSAWAFVALQDGHTKQLGTYKKGDIFKAATFKAPARHIRGNVFDTSNGPTCNVTQWTGPNYLR